MSGYADFSNTMSETDRFAIIKRANPLMSDEQAWQYLTTLEERFDRKRTWLERGFSNTMAERALDKQGWPRPFGWHSVFFYPDSSRPRTRYIALLIFALIGLGWALQNG